MATGDRIELSLMDPKSIVLPLNYPATIFSTIFLMGIITLTPKELNNNFLVFMY